MNMQDGIRAVQHAFAHATNLRWPMYVRQARQFLRGAIEGFDERKYGFASVVDLLRAAGKESVLRIERDRQGAVRVFPGINLMERPRSVDGLPVDVEIDDDAGNRIEPGNQALAAAPVEEMVADLPIVDAQVDPMMADADDEPQPFAPEPVVDDGDTDVEDEGPQPGNELVSPAGGRRRSGAGSRSTRGGGRSAKSAKPRTAAAPRAVRARKTTRGRGRGGE
jgi:hypothetical protein